LLYCPPKPLLIRGITNNTPHFLHFGFTTGYSLNPIIAVLPPVELILIDLPHQPFDTPQLFANPVLGYSPRPCRCPLPLSIEKDICKMIVGSPALEVSYSTNLLCRHGSLVHQKRGLPFLDIPFCFTLLLPPCGQVTGAHILIIPPYLYLDDYTASLLSDVNAFRPLSNKTINRLFGTKANIIDHILRINSFLLKL
jgi:hypothetical protein